MSQASARYLELARSPDRRLEALLRKGRAPAPETLAGWEWRGYNTPFFAALLGIRKFVKGFFSGADGLEGYNIPVRQNGLAGDWLQKPNPESPTRFGFYRVAPVVAGARDSLYPGAALLDYGASARNPPWRPERVLRDYLVADPEGGEVLIGKAYLALGPRVPSNFFILERLRETKWRP